MGHWAHDSSLLIRLAGSTEILPGSITRQKWMIADDETHDI